MRRRFDTIRSFRNLLIFSGLFNIVLAAPLMVPGLADLYLSTLSDMNTALHLRGAPSVPAIHPAHALLVNTAGIDLVLIGAVMLYAALDPDGRQGIVLINAVGRLVFAAVATYYVLASNLMPLVLVPALVDVLISLSIVRFLVLLHRKDQRW